MITSKRVWLVDEVGTVIRLATITEMIRGLRNHNRLSIEGQMYSILIATIPPITNKNNSNSHKKLAR